MFTFKSFLFSFYSSKKKKWSAPRKIIGIFSFGLTLFLLFIGFLQVSGNFHAVVKGELYRSAQPSPQAIEYAHKAYNIQTIINLRGESYGASWYKKERMAAQKLGITHVDFDMHSNKKLSPEEVFRLLSLLKEAKKPILIHCKSGADRAGLVAALYIAGVSKGTQSEAESQLSIRYGHFSLPFIGEYNMDRTLKMMMPYFGFSVL